MSYEECPKSPTGKHHFVHFKCVWCGRPPLETLRARYRFARKMSEQHGVIGVVEVEKEGKTYVVPLAVARAFNMKIVRQVPESEIEE